MKFEELDILSSLKRAVADMGLEEMTPIQAKTIDTILSGRDVSGQAKTGSGKTLAFALPCIENINPDDGSLQAVILAPTRELALQICGVMRKLLKYTDDIKVLPIYGGQPIMKQISALRKGIQIVVGTPGRILDHIKRHTLKMQNVHYVVLDEADEMLNMGFREDIEKILAKIPKEHRMLLFSATMPRPIMDIVHKYQNDPIHIKAESESRAALPDIKQYYVEIKERTKNEAVCRLIDFYEPKLAMVFCNTKRRVDALTEFLGTRGYKTGGIHGDMDQSQRDNVMRMFRNGSINILVATDIAARGLDIENVEVVINYDIPTETEFYIHRIGRTGRAGKSGIAYSFVSGKEKEKIKEISAYIKKNIALTALPSFTDISNEKANRLLKEASAFIKAGGMDRYIKIAEDFENKGGNVKLLAAALLKMRLYDPDIDEFDTGKSGDKIGVIHIDAGSGNGIRIRDVIGAIAGECGISGNDIGSVEVHDSYTLVEVPKKYVVNVLKGMKNKKIRKISVKVSVCK